MSPERQKDVIQPGTLIVMSEGVTCIWASNTACVIMFFSVKSQCSNLLLFVSRNFIKCVIMVQPTNKIKCSAIVSTSRIDFLKSLAMHGRACCKSIASRKADGMNAHQIRTKATIGTNTKKRRRYSVVRSCCGTLKSMGLGLEGCLIWCSYRSNKTQH